MGDWSVDASHTEIQACMLASPRVLLMRVVSAFFLVMKSLELGVTLQGLLQKSLGFSLLGLAHITAAYKFLYFALGAEWTWSGSNQLLLIVCLIILLSASKYKNFCVISEVLCKTLIWSELHSEEFLSKPVLSFQFVIKSQTRQALCGFGFHCKHFTLL